MNLDWQLCPRYHCKLMMCNERKLDTPRIVTGSKGAERPDAVLIQTLQATWSCSVSGEREFPGATELNNLQTSARDRTLMIFCSSVMCGLVIRGLQALRDGGWVRAIFILIEWAGLDCGSFNSL